MFTLARKLARRIRHNSRGDTPPPAKLKYSDYADGAGYVLTAVSLYGGFAAHDPNLAFYIGLGAAGLYAMSNWLVSKGD